MSRPETAVLLGAGSWLAGILLTGAAAWLLVTASTLPPVLSLSVAVVTVRGSAIARPLLRYLERLAAHEAGFARMAAWRSQVYATLLTQPMPRRRGELLTRIVQDVDLLDQAEQHGVDDAALSAVRPGALRVLEGAMPFAYCVPGRSPRVVLTGGTLKLLAPRPLAAVLAHEQAHLRSRHDLVLEAFVALYQALPARLRSRTSLDAVRLLLEMLADDAARRRCGSGPLEAALTAMGAAADPVSAGDVEAGADARGRDVEEERRRRVRRLGAPPAAPALLTAVVYLVAVGVLVLPTVVVVIPWLDQALPAWPL